MPRKIIRIPEKAIGYDEPMNSFMGVVDTHYFQRLRDINQLDLVYKIFPGAKHSRLEHSIGVLHHERNILGNINSDGDYEIGPTQMVTCELAGLLHDIAHPPYSHAVEYVLMSHGEPDHDEKALEILGEMEGEIRKVHGADYALLHDIFKRKDPLYQTIWTVVGSDVLDYINRDADRCGVSIDSDANRMETYACFDGKTYGIDSKVDKVVRKHAQSYTFMYLEVYNRKACSMWKGLVRRGVNEAIEAGDVKPKDIWQMTDQELSSVLAASEGTPREIYTRIRDRVGPNTFLSIKIEGEEDTEETKMKPIKVVGMPEDRLMALTEKFSKVGNVLDFERSVEKSLELAPGDATLAEMPHIRMLQPKDIPLLDVERGWTSLFKRIPRTKDDINTDIRREYAVRVGVPAQARGKAFASSDLVLELLDSF